MVTHVLTSGNGLFSSNKPYFFYVIEEAALILLLTLILKDIVTNMGKVPGPNAAGTGAGGSSMTSPRCSIM